MKSSTYTTKIKIQTSSKLHSENGICVILTKVLCTCFVFDTITLLAIKQQCERRKRVEEDDGGK
jgi:hypothetical protein